MKDIRASIGVLTYQSEAELERCLESVKDFKEIIIADSGSTDGTLELAKRYGCRIISQSNPGHAIEDYSQERNILLAAATEPWFFYLDSDEAMSPELVAFIREVANENEPMYDAYRVRYLKTSADLKKIYRTYKEYYQVRLVRTTIGARFVKPVHERLELPKNARVGQTEAPWYVPLDRDLEFSVFAPKAWKRTGTQASMWKPSGVLDAFSHVIVDPLTQIVKALFKLIAVKVKWGRQAIPARYELLRVLYALDFSIQHARRLFFK